MHGLGLVVACLAVAFGAALSPLAPEQVHLALHGQDGRGFSTGMTATWFSQGKPGNCSVQYGVVGGPYKLAMGSGPSNYLEDFGFHCVAPMEDLNPGDAHLYRVGSAKDNAWSEWHKFRAPSRDPTEAFSVSIFGDMGWLSASDRPMASDLEHLASYWSAHVAMNWTAVDTRDTLERLKDSKSIDWVWHLGDIGYADDSFIHEDTELHFNYETAYNGYMNWMQSLASTMPYMVTVGNHEAECHSPACVADPWKGPPLSNFTAYNHRWNMPSASSGGVASMWYSFNYGPAAFIALNTETDFPEAAEENRAVSGFPWLKGGEFAPKGEYLRWLEEELRRASQEKAAGLRKWIIVGGHRPFWHSNDDNHTLVDLLTKKYKVDMWLSGHEHAYQRNATRGGEPILIFVGGAGCDEMDTLPEGAPRVVIDRYGTVTTARVATGVLDVNMTHLHWRLIDSKDGTILDQVVHTNEGPLKDGSTEERSIVI